jgi:hypothetical protein
MVSWRIGLIENLPFDGEVIIIFSIAARGRIVADLIFREKIGSSL